MNALPPPTAPTEPNACRPGYECWGDQDQATENAAAEAYRALALVAATDGCSLVEAAEAIMCQIQAGWNPTTYYGTMVPA